MSKQQSPLQRSALQQASLQQAPAGAGSTGKSGRKFRVRLVPIVMVVVLATITVKANHLWQGLSISFGRPSQAQAANNQNAQQPAAPTGAPTQLGANQANPNQANSGQSNQAAGSQQGAGQPLTGQNGAGQAAASQQTAQIQPPAPTGQGSAAAPAGSTGAAQPSQDLLAQDQQRKLARDPFNYTDEEVDVLQQLAKRRTELDQRARQLDEREALIKAAEQRMDQKMAELKALQATVQDLLKQRNAADERQLQSLVKIYENMKPKAAAQIFEEMDMDVLLDVVSRMNERKVSPILALVSPTRAKELTYELAERRQMPIPQ
jgi:flagellar motility protein MotE (MotC chaperone)